MDARLPALNRRRLLGASLTVALARAASAQTPLPEILYGGDAAFAPFESLDDTGTPRGFQIDLLSELGQIMQVRFVVLLRPWQQTEAEFRAGRLDVTAMVDTEERRRWALFARGHATPAFAVYHRPDTPAPQSLQGLNGKRIAVLEGEPMRDTLNTALAGFPGPFVRTASAAEALDVVEQGRADIAVLPRAFADPLIGGAGHRSIIASRQNLQLQTYAMAVAPDQPTLLPRLQQGLDTLESNGQLEALRTRWLSSHRELFAEAQARQGLLREREWNVALTGASATALLLMGVGLWRRSRRLAVERDARRIAEDALQRAVDLLDRAFAQNPEPMLVVQRDGGLVRDVNQALGSLLGVPPASLIGQPLQSLEHHVDVTALQQLVQSLEHDGQLRGAPLRLKRMDGAERDCLISADRFTLDGNAQVFGMIRDITDALRRDATMRSGYEALADQLAASRAATKAAQDARDRAESSLRDFTRLVSHDLKSPIRAVQGLAGLLRERLLAGKVHDALGFSDHITQSAKHMDAMVSALGRLAQVSRKPIQRTAVDMRQMVRQVWETLELAAPDDRIRFEAAPLEVAHADQDLTRQIWQNLLENARKYSARVASPRIRVDSYVDQRRVWFRITDNGAGFDMARANTLYLPFQRMHAGKDFEGTGVGLSLVKRIVDDHGGEIRLRSTPGVGTVAEFTLDPLVPRQP